MKSFIRIAALLIFSLNAFALAQDYQAPSANAGDDITVRVGARVVLKSLSSDPDGDELEHRWSIASMPEGSKATLINPNSESPSFFADREGTYKIHLVVSDGIFISNLDIVMVSVTANSAPVIVVDSYRTARVGEFISFDASASMDLEMDSLSYRWSLLKTPKGSNAKLQKQESARVEFIPDREGLYTLKLWVSDGLLASQSHIALRVYEDSCEIPKTLEDRHCEGVIEIANNKDLSRYLATLGLENSDSNAKNIKLSGALSLSGNLSLATPCRITTSKNIDLNITGKLCLNASKTYISSASRINTGGDIEIKGGGIDLASKVILSAEDITLYSPGEDEGSAIRIQGDAVINAKSLSLSAHAVSSIGSRARLNINGGVAIEVRGEGEVALGRESKIDARSVRLSSNGAITLLRGVVMDSPLIQGTAAKIEALGEGAHLVSQSVYLDADECIGTSEIVIDSPVKGGRCLADSSLLAMISPLSKQSYFVGESLTFDIGNSKGYESATIDFGDNTTHEFAQDQTQIAHSYTSKGIYEATLTLTKGEESAGSVVSIIITDNIAPEIFDFAFEVEYDRDGYPVKKVEFSTQGKTADLGGSIVQYEYDFGDGSELRLSSSPKVRHAYQQWGTYQVSVRVKDNLGAWSQPITKELILQNQMPTIEFEIPQEVYPYQVIALNGIDSSDPEGDALTYEWLIDREHYSGNVVDAHFFEEVGLHHIMLIAKDSKGLRNYITKKIRVVEPPEGALSAKIFVHPGTRDESDSILGEVWASDDSTIENGEIVKRAWTLSNGTIQEGNLFTARLDPGRYTLGLRIESSEGTVAHTGTILNIGAKYQKSEIASDVNATIAGYSANAFNPTSLTLNISFDGDGIDLDQAIDVAYDYNSLVSSITKTNANQISVAITALDGLNELTFSAFDTRGHYIQVPISFLAGSRSITADVLDSMSNNVTTGSFKAIHTQTNTPVTITTTNNSNQFVINNAPASDLYVYFLKTDGDFVGKRIDAITNDLDLTLRGFSTVSATANLDLSQGSSGWTFDSNYVTLVQVDGENRFEVVLEAGESTEYSHAFTAANRYLYQGVQIKGNIVDAYTNVILRNYTQNTVAVRSLSPQDVGYNEEGQSFDIDKGDIFLEANVGDQMEVIVQFVAPPSSLKSVLESQDSLYRSIREIRTSARTPQGAFCQKITVTELFDICQKCKEDNEGPVRSLVAEELKYFSLGQYTINEMPGVNKSSIFYLLLGENPNLCTIQSAALSVEGVSPIVGNSSSRVDNVFYKKRKRSFTPFEFGDTTPLIASNFSNQKDLALEIRYSDMGLRPSTFRFAKDKILKRYEKGKRFRYGSALWAQNPDDNKYDRSDTWAHYRTKEFLDNVYGVNNQNNRFDFKYNDISNINAGSFGGDPPHSEHRQGLDIDFIVGGFENDRKFSLGEFEGIKNFIETGANSYAPYIKRIIASQSLTDSFVKYSCINGRAATKYIKNTDSEHFNHWHVDILPGNTSSRQSRMEDKRSTPISYTVTKEQGGNQTVLVINFPPDENAIYSFLLIKPDLRTSPNENPKLFTKKSGASIIEETIVGDFKYSFRPDGSATPETRRAQIKIILPEGEGKLSSLRGLQGYKVRINKFMEGSYGVGSFRKESSCNTIDIDLESDLLCTVENSVKVNPKGTYLPTWVHDYASPPTLYSISEEVIQSGFIEIKAEGDYSYTSGGPDNAQRMTGVFVSPISDTSFLFPGVGSDADYGEVTEPIYYNTPRDIPQDFRIPFDGWIGLQIPEGANRVLFSSGDWKYGDNADRDGDYKAKIRWKALKGHSQCLME